MRDIYELIRQRETEVDRFQKEIERVQNELQALRLAATLLDDGTDGMVRPAVAAAPVARESQAYAATPITRPAQAPAAPPAAWASAKQFP